MRHLLRHKGYSAINIAGLAIGMACCLLILLYVQHELSYDRFHEKADRIYRLVPEVNVNGTMTQVAVTPAPDAPRLIREFPEIRHAVRIDVGQTPLLRYGEKRFIGDGFVFADSFMFEVFSFPLLRGNPRTALTDPFSLVLTKTAARTVFGDEDPMGKIVTYDNRFDLTVTGIVQDVPDNSYIQFKYLSSFVSLRDVLGQGNALDENQDDYNYYTYLLLTEQSRPDLLVKQFLSYVAKHLGGDEALKKIRLTLQPLTGIHLDTETRYELLGPKGDTRYIYAFSAIALVTVLIACINFMNLAIARSSGRAKEVGLRKAVGARRGQLVKQFLG